MGVQELLDVGTPLTSLTGSCRFVGLAGVDWQKLSDPAASVTLPQGG